MVVYRFFLCNFKRMLSLGETGQLFTFEIACQPQTAGAPKILLGIFCLSLERDERNSPDLFKSAYLKRCAQSARPWKKAVKEVKEVKTNKTKKLKKTLVQLWHKMAPTWSQNGPKTVPKWPQVGPKMVPRCPKKATRNNKKQQKHENET